MANPFKYRINYTGSSKVIRRIVDRLNNIEAAMLGTRHDEAFYGDWGNEAYEHSQLREGNPHNVTLDDLGIADVPRQLALLADLVGSEDYWVTHETETEYIIDHNGDNLVLVSAARLLAWH